MLVIGFNYDFHSLDPDAPPNELGEAFREILNVPRTIPIVLLLKSFFPVLKWIIVRALFFVFSSIA